MQGKSQNLKLKNLHKSINFLGLGKFMDSQSFKYIKNQPRKNKILEPESLLERAFVLFMCTL